MSNVQSIQEILKDHMCYSAGLEDDLLNCLQKITHQDSVKITELEKNVAHFETLSSEYKEDYQESIEAASTVITENTELERKIIDLRQCISHCIKTDHVPNVNMLGFDLLGNEMKHSRIFKCRYAIQGTHVHCRLFSAQGMDYTFAKLGDVCMDLEDWENFKQQFPLVVFQEE